MYNNLDLYYLEHMGIIPWIKKDKPTHNPVRFIILLTDESSSKAQSLFKQILSYINISEESLLIIKLKDDIKLASQLENYRPMALLSLGAKIGDLHLNYPVQEAASLDYLLKNPSYKKELLQKINLLKAFI